MLYKNIIIRLKTLNIYKLNMAQTTLLIALFINYFNAGYYNLKE